jgi:hypothetical protein
MGLLFGGLVALFASLIALWVLRRARGRDVPGEAADDLVAPAAFGEAEAPTGRPREVERSLTA